MDARNPALVPASGVDAGLRAYLLRTYDYVAIGLGVSALSAYGVLSLATTTTAVEGAKAFGAGRWLTPAGQALFSVPAAIATLVASLYLLNKLSNAVRSDSRAVALGAYLLFAATFGLNLAVIAASYTPNSVTFALSATAATFAATSLWAHSTRRDISGWGPFLGMGLLGLLGVMVASLLLGTVSAVETSIGAVGVVLFTGLIAYDTQALRRAYSPAMTAADRDRAALWGAVDLFLDAVNLFQFLLMLGGSKDD